MIHDSILHDGAPASRDTLIRVAFAGFAHFTAMQVRDGAIRGLDLHLGRLRSASQTMFGASIADDAVLANVRAALLDGPGDASVTVVVSSRPGEFEAATGTTTLETFVRTAAPAEPPDGPLRLDAIEHERDLPTIKHVGEVAKTLALRRAQQRGFDDAVFVDRHGRVSEGTIWNVAFWDGDAVVWPRAAMLDGVTQQLLRRELHAAGVRQRTADVHADAIDASWSAVVLNSWRPGVAVSRIGSTRLADAAGLVDLLHATFAAAPAIVLGSASS